MTTDPECERSREAWKTIAQDLASKFADAKDRIVVLESDLAESLREREQARRQYLVRIAELEASLAAEKIKNSEHEEFVAVRADIIRLMDRVKELEAERKKWVMATNASGNLLMDAGKRIAALEENRDYWHKIAVEWSQERDRGIERIAELEAERDDYADAVFERFSEAIFKMAEDVTGTKGDFDSSPAETEDETRGHIIGQCKEHISERIAELEAERDEARKAADDVAERSIATACDLDASREQVALLRMRQQPLIDLLHQSVKWLDRIEGEPKCAPTGKPGTDVRPLIHDIRTILDQNP